MNIGVHRAPPQGGHRAGTQDHMRWRFRKPRPFKLPACIRTAPPAPSPRPGPCYRPPVAVLANPAEKGPAVREAVNGGRWSVSPGLTPTPCVGQTCAHLREQTTCTGLWNRHRHCPVWKSQSRITLGVLAWAEANSELLPSSARADT